MPVAVIIDWYGPYNSLEDFIADAKRMPQNGRYLYMGVKAGNIVNYIGLTKRPSSRFDYHRNMEHSENKKFYFGEIVTKGLAGRKTKGAKKTALDLDIAEHALILELDPPLNDKRKQSNPDDCVSIFSRFFDVDDGEKPVRTLPKFPRLIAYDWWDDEWYSS